MFPGQSLRNTLSGPFRFFEDRYAGLRSTLGAVGVPSVFIVGAQKSGTTTLYDLGVQCGFWTEEFRKEIGYFGRKSKHHGLGWYFGNFSTTEACDATPDYLYWPNALEEIAAEFPDAKIIVSLRHPTQRLLSQFYHEETWQRDERFT